MVEPHPSTVHLHVAVRKNQLLGSELLRLHLQLVSLERYRGRGGAEELVVELAGLGIEEAEESDEVGWRLEGQKGDRELRGSVGLGAHAVRAQVEGGDILAPLGLDRVLVRIADCILTEAELELRVLAKWILHVDVHCAYLIKHGRDRDGLPRLPPSAATPKLEDHGRRMDIALPSGGEDDLALNLSREATLELDREGHHLLGLDFDLILLDGEVTRTLQRDKVGDGLLRRIGQLNVLRHVHAQERREDDDRFRHVVRQVLEEKHDKEQHVLRLRRSDVRCLDREREPDLRERADDVHRILLQVLKDVARVPHHTHGLAVRHVRLDYHRDDDGVLQIGVKVRDHPWRVLVVVAPEMEVQPAEQDGLSSAVDVGLDQALRIPSHLQLGADLLGLSRVRYHVLAEGGAHRLSDRFGHARQRFEGTQRNPVQEEDLDGLQDASQPSLHALRVESLFHLPPCDAGVQALHVAEVLLVGKEVLWPHR
mmetsp:Transcript_57171/g.122970  ORF Transcript_57171/g.122970 Transcript_57171/m.122970 type:complete len:482 (+) Transcript_57171:2772-4217(+)